MLKCVQLVGKYNLCLLCEYANMAQLKLIFYEIHSNPIKRWQLQNTDVREKQWNFCCCLSDPLHVQKHVCWRMVVYFVFNIHERYLFYPPADHPSADSSSVHRMACLNQTLGRETQEWCCEDESQRLQASCSHLCNKNESGF